MFAAANGAIWYGCGTALCRLRSGLVTEFSRNAGVPPDRWNAILQDRQGNLWVRSSSRLLVRQRGTRSFAASGGLSSSESGNLYLDHQGRILAATDRGVARLVNGRWEYTGMQQGLPVALTSCLWEDREGSLWIGLGGAGLVRWVGPDEWEGWTRLDGLAGSAVRAMFRDTRGTLWVGTESGLQRLPTGNRQGRVWTRKDGLAGTPVRSIIGAPDGTLWIGCAPGGVSRFDPRTGKLSSYGKSSGLSNDSVMQVFRDRDGQLWAVTHGPLFRSRGAGAHTRFERWIPPLSDASENFFQIAQDASGGLWLASDHGLVGNLDGRWMRFTQRDGLHKDELYNVACTRDGSVWISYDSAPEVSRLTFPGGKLHIENFRGGAMRSGDTSFVQSDSRNHIWFGGDNGVNLYEGGSWQYFNHSDGLLWNDCVTNAFYEDRDGSVWIGTTQGLSHFRPSPDVHKLVPPVVITSLRLGSAAIDPSLHLEFVYPSHLLQIGFAGLNYRNEERLRFRYRLDGLFADWIETDQHQVNYPALAPGEYSFAVMAKARDAWSAPARVSFRILPPWWQTWWFRCLIVFSGLAGTWFLLQLRLRHNLAERRRLERAVADRTRELFLEKARVIEEKTRVDQQNQRIERLLVRAQEASRLKGEFLANMSHEIRTPMNGILGMSALGLEASTPEEQRECFEVVQASAQSLLALLNDVLDFSKIEAGRMELDPAPFSLRACLHAAVSTMRAAADKKGLAIVWRVAPEVPSRLVGDEGRLRQVILNLIGNAIKFTDSGVVTLGASLKSDEGPLPLVEFFVRDTGLGIAADKQRFIFEAFCQGDGSTARRYGGTGLGLTISARIVKLMGGKIWVESRPGEGSTFSFNAYFGRSSEAEHAVRTAPGILPETGTLDILLAEDNVVNQKLAVRLLEKRGHRVAVADDGSRAIALYEARRFDLILMDIQMPGMDGFEATAAIRDRERRNGRRTPIIAMTAHAGSEYSEKCQAAGMNGHVTKPVDPARLFSAIHQAVAATGLPA